MAGDVRDSALDERLAFSQDLHALPVAVEPKPLAAKDGKTAFLRPALLRAQWHLWITGLSGLAVEERGRGAAFNFIPVFIGAGAVSYFAMAFEPSLLALAALLVCAAGGAMLAAERPLMRAGLLACSLIAGGAAAAKIETLRSDSILLGDQITTRVTGRILSVEKFGSAQKAVIEVISTERPALKYQPERIKVTLRNAPPDLAAGDGVRALFLLRPPSGPVRPGSFDFAFDSYFDRIGASGVSLSLVERAEVAQGGPFAEAGFWFDRRRTAIAERVRRQINGQSGEMSAALITGLTGGISAETNEAMRVSGLAHVTSISGLHMALVAGSVMGMIRLLLAMFPGFASRHPTKKIGAAFAVAAAFAYLLLSGGGVATLRSFIMLGVMLIAVLFDQAAISMRNLVIAALIILILTPHEVMGPSFQMSFAATAALIGAYQLYSERRMQSAARAELGPWQRALRHGALFLGGLAATSLVAGAATAIFSAYHFNRIAPLGLFANLAAMPAVSLIVMPMALLAVLLMPFGAEGIPLYLMGNGVDVMLSVAHRAAAMSPGGASGLMPPGSLLALTAALALFCLLNTRLRLAALPLAAAGLALVFARQLPDIAISEDARLVAVRDAERGLIVSRAKPNRFTLDNWLRAYDAPAKILPAPSGAELRAFSCAEGFCVHETAQNIRIGQTDNREQMQKACRGADLLVVTFPARYGDCGNDGAFLILARDLARNGAAEVFVSRSSAAGRPAFEVRYAHAGVLRPWQRHRVFSRASRSMEPYKPKPKLTPPAKSLDQAAARQ